MKVKTALRETDDNLAAYSGAVKTMRIGDQELSILERVTITNDHVKQINKLIANEEINATSLFAGNGLLVVNEITGNIAIYPVCKIQSAELD